MFQAKNAREVEDVVVACPECGEFATGLVRGQRDWLARRAPHGGERVFTDEVQRELLGMVREARGAAEDEGEDEGEDEDEDEDGPDGEGGPGEARGTPQPSCYEAAETGWNAWQARVNAIRAAVDAERDDGLEIKSLGSVNRVNTPVDDATACRKALRRPAISLPLMARIDDPAWG